MSELFRNHIVGFTTRWLKCFKTVPVAVCCKQFNPLVMNVPAHSYHLDESTVSFRGTRGDFCFLFHFYEILFCK